MSEIFGNGVMGGGGLTNSKLALADAQTADVRSGKKFYSGDKQIKTGTLADVTQATPTITVDAAGKITASATQAAGVVAAGTKSATKQLTVQAAKTVTPSTSAQTAAAKGVFTTGIITVAAVYAVIGVTYPSGSTCTCSNGSTTLTAKDTSGRALFVLTAKGTWTVKAVKGSQSASKAVSITADGQVATVTLAFELVLFKNGAYQNIGSFNNATITNGNLVMTASGNDGAGGPIHRTFVTDVKLDLTNYKTLTFSLAEFTINSTYPTSRKVWLGVSSNTIAWQAIPADSNVKAKTVLTNTDQGTNKTVTVDISALTGSFYVFVYENVYGSTIVSSKSIIIN